MDQMDVLRVDEVTLVRRGFSIVGTLILSPYHVVFRFHPNPQEPSAFREVWICYPIIERMNKSRGSARLKTNDGTDDTDVDYYCASHIRVQCKDFTYYSFDFVNDVLCTEVYRKLSGLVSAPRLTSLRALYAFDYKPNVLEKNLAHNGWGMYDPVHEYERQGLTGEFWRLSTINQEYRFCPSYPDSIVVPGLISDNVLKHASKFRSKQRIPAIVYRHRSGPNHNVIARCAQPLVGLNIQNRLIQDEKLILEIFECQNRERSSIPSDDAFREQPQRNLIVDLRPLTNAMAQHALGAGTENIDNYRGKADQDSKVYNVDKIFCNIDNIHVMRDLINKLAAALDDLDRNPSTAMVYFQHGLTKTLWLHRLSIILQSVDRISKSVHLNNTNVIIHCSDGWDRTSQVSALTQLCLDPYYRTTAGFQVLIEKEWVSFGFKFATRADHGGCIGAITPKTPPENGEPDEKNGMSMLLQRAARAANHIKTTAQNAASDDGEAVSTYSGSNERLPVFHQFLDCVFQIFRQHPDKFEFNTRLLKRLLYHYYSCQYGTFLCDSERERRTLKLPDQTVSVWDYFNSRPQEFSNPQYVASDEVIFFNFTDVKWWCELYGRLDEEMNGLSNSLDRKFAQMKMGRRENENQSVPASKTPTPEVQKAEAVGVQTPGPAAHLA